MPGLKYPVTPDRRYFAVRGRLWRMSNPHLAPHDKARLVKQLMAARRAVKAAKATQDPESEAIAHGLVNEAKRGLGERGPVWWTDGTSDFNRHAVKNTPYADWYARVKRQLSEHPVACGETPTRRPSTR
jgi:hypothetical protein